jgi:hypothetical protein
MHMCKVVLWINNTFYLFFISCSGEWETSLFERFESAMYLWSELLQADDQQQDRIHVCNYINVVSNYLAAFSFIFQTMC